MSIFEIQVLGDPPTDQTPPILWQNIIVADDIWIALERAKEAAEQIAEAKGFRVLDGATHRVLDLRLLNAL